MQKEDRQKCIRLLISEHEIRTQSELMALLKKQGAHVTQASVSRDLEEIGVLKSQGLYALPSEMSASAKFRLSRIRPSGDALLVLHCDPGFASAISAEIDSLNIPGIVGTIAGDDTIFVAVSNRKSLTPTIEKLQNLFPL